MDNPATTKQVVVRFNKEVIEEGNIDSFNELMDPTFVNRSAPPNANDGISMWHTFNDVLRRAFPDLKVEIYDQIAEADKVTTRKAVVGTHTGPLMDIPATQERIRIEVIDIVRVKDGKYVEHWGLNNFAAIIETLRSKSADGRG